MSACAGRCTLMLNNATMVVDEIGMSCLNSWECSSVFSLLGAAALCEPLEEERRRRLEASPWMASPLS